MSRGLPRVLVLTGTSDHPFPRLLDALPALVREGVAAEVRVQSALPPPEAPGIVALGMLARDAVARELAEADVVVTHGGSGSCFEAIRAGHRPIVVPRRASLAEHVDDHQADVAAELELRGLTISPPDPLAETLADAVRRIAGAPRPSPPIASDLGARLRAVLGPKHSFAPHRPGRASLRVRQVESDTFRRNLEACGGWHPLQSRAWGDARRRDGWRPRHWVASIAGRTLAAAQTLSRTGVPPYLPFGPAFSPTDAGAVAAAGLLRHLRRTSYTGLLWAPSADAGGLVHARGLDAVALDAPALTGVVELGPDTEMLARLRPTWRGTLRKALADPRLSIVDRDPVTFVPHVLDRVRALARERGFRAPVLSDVGGVFATQARQDGDRLLACSVVEAGREVELCVSALSGKAAHLLWTVREPDANEGAGRLAIWAHLRAARDAGCKVYDLSGIDPTGNPGVASFKLGLRPRLTPVPALRWLPPAWLPTPLARAAADLLPRLRGAPRPG